MKQNKTKTKSESTDQEKHEKAKEQLTEIYNNEIDRQIEKLSIDKYNKKALVRAREKSNLINKKNIGENFPVHACHIPKFNCYVIIDLYKDEVVKLFSDFEISDKIEEHDSLPRNHNNYILESENRIEEIFEVREVNYYYCDHDDIEYQKIANHYILEKI